MFSFGAITSPLALIGSTLFWVVTPTFTLGSCAPLRLPSHDVGRYPDSFGRVLVRKSEKGAYVRISMPFDSVPISGSAACLWFILRPYAVFVDQAQDLRTHSFVASETIAGST